MPSKNSINKPKITAKHQRKSILASKKRQNRARQAVTVIKSSSGSTEIVPISSGGGVIANKILSNKKAKKLERNFKYAQMRKQEGRKKNTDIVMNEQNIADVKEKENIYRKALWDVVESSKVNGVPLALPSGEGTTLGSASF
ncbi:hypothetical protein CANINC_003330 [Pichia inconspicua]|uniref:Ribosome biogenesis protein ALB1 n=1 Tax=Pichia inconspicua TaxID=52247 RepID=A0A4T0WZ44_9ASCO|nr:hypothetical protein CANINC_003330 [[Candida] inconspicua]